MTISIDCRMIDASGIGVYLRECLPWFLKSSNRFLLVGDAGRLAALVKNAPNARVLDCKTGIFSPEELFFFPRRVLKHINASDIFYSPYFNIPSGIAVPVYTTIHDIIFPDMPELVSAPGLFLRMFFFRRAAKKSKKIFTVSAFSKSRIEHFLGTEKPVIVTHSAIQPSIASYAGSRRNTAKKKHIVFVGNIKKHKGLDCLLDAFTKARADGLPHRLIIIGSRDNFRSSDDSALRGIDALCPEAVFFTGYISNEQLMEYLASAALLVQPSLYEGFGLPPLEAMVLGTPALVSDIPVFREIYRDFPVRFFHARDSMDLKNNMVDMLRNGEPGLFRLPEELSLKYTFEKTASVILGELE